MKKLITTLILLVIAPITLAVTWDLPTPYGDSTHSTQIARSFAKEVNAKSNGKLTIKIHSGGSLIKHPEIYQAVKSRQVKIGEVLIGRLANIDPIFKLDNIPFLATTFDSAKKLYQASKKAVNNQLGADGLALLYALPWPPQSLYSNKQVNSLQDLAGLKMRTYSPATLQLAELMNTTAVNIAFSDVAQAFATNAVSVMITSPSTGVSSRSWDYISHFTTISAWIPKNMLFVNKRAFNQLDKATQQVILTAAANAQKKGWALASKLDVEHTNTLKENGVVVLPPTKKLDGELRAIGTTMLNDWLIEAKSTGKSIISDYKKM